MGETCPIEEGGEGEANIEMDLPLSPSLFESFLEDQEKTSWHGYAILSTPFFLYSFLEKNDIHRV